MRDKPSLKTERRLYRGNDRKVSVAKRMSGHEPQEAYSHYGLVGSKPQVVK
jgi:hypothetical protein